MTPHGRVQYARSGDVNIAYRVDGDGSFDVVMIPGFTSSVDPTLSDERIALVRDALRITRFARLVSFDKRGTGMSDRGVGIASLEERMDDVRAVMDAVGLGAAHLFAISEGGPMALLFAATYPDRVRSLTLRGTFARFTRSEDHPWLPTEEERAAVIPLMEQAWGTGRVLAEFFAPAERTPELRDYLALCETRCASPGAIRQLMEMNLRIDVRAVLPAISAPTLVIHNRGDGAVPVECGRYLAEHIPGARFEELAVDAHTQAGGDDTAVDLLEEFVTGARPAAFSDRVLATIMFSDIVDSTARAAALGDGAWKHLLDRHDRIVAEEVEHFRGVSVKHTGDGVLAHFDGPARAVACALAISDAVGSLGLSVRSGVHTGEIELRGHDIGGIAVHAAARIMALARPGEVLASRTVRDLTVGSGLHFDDRGEQELKGVPDRWPLYAASTA